MITLDLKKCSQENYNDSIKNELLFWIFYI